MTEDLDKQIDQFINDFVEQSLQGEAFSNQSEDQKMQSREQLKNYFNQLVTDTLVDNLTEEQVDELSRVDLDSQEGEEKVVMFASQVPGFIFIVQEVLGQASTLVRQSGVIPE